MREVSRFKRYGSRMDETKPRMETEAPSIGFQEFQMRMSRRVLMGVSKTRATKEVTAQDQLYLREPKSGHRFALW